jgi:hypothetical protein
LENENPPDALESGTRDISFTKNADRGRYGLFPPQPGGRAGPGGMTVLWTGLADVGDMRWERTAQGRTRQRCSVVRVASLSSMRVKCVGRSSELCWLFVSRGAAGHRVTVALPSRTSVINCAAGFPQVAAGCSLCRWIVTRDQDVFPACAGCLWLPSPPTGGDGMSQICRTAPDATEGRSRLPNLWMGREVHGG